MQSKIKKSLLLLIILDGWGYSNEEFGNALLAAATPNFDRLWQSNPHSLLSASGLDVGLPAEQMGNSEVGHLHIGAGRLVLQELTKLDLAIQSGEFFNNPLLCQVVDEMRETGKTLHLLGLLSPGGVHSHNQQLEMMVELAAKRGLRNICIHPFLDGRDTPPKSALTAILSMEAKLKQLGCGRIASLAGRYYAMDRDQRWERIEPVYQLLTTGQAAYQAATAVMGLENAYARGETDEFVKATLIGAADGYSGKITDGDSVIFMNFRADRARQLSYAFRQPNFTAFTRPIVPQLAHYLTLTQYASDLAAEVVFQTDNLEDVLGSVIAKHGLKQLRIAETEKYAHVTYFFNGGNEQVLPGEERILIPSPKVATYDLQPAMHAPLLTKQLIEAIQSQRFDFIVCNYANPDMVGHTGNFTATCQAAETIDQLLGEILPNLQAVGGELIITADHGNAEKMLDPQTGQPHTAHTTALVPFIYCGRPAKIRMPQAKLTDIAPTVLHLLGLAIPTAMTGQTLVELTN